MTSTNRRPRLLLTRQLPEKYIRTLESVFDLDYEDIPTPISQQRVLERIRANPPDAMFFTGNTRINEELLTLAGDKLKMLATFSVGYDHIDVNACKKRGITLGYTPDVLVDGVSELAVTLLLATSRRIVESMKTVRNGKWGTSSNIMYMCGKSLVNATVGIVGLGQIGLAIARRLQPFNIARVVYSGTREKQFETEEDKKFFTFVKLDELLRQSDFVIISCSLNNETKNMFDKQAFQQMKNDAILINISRGGVVDQEALYEALTTGQIHAAGLDVTTPEPLPTDHPLLSLDNCTIFPHIGSADTYTRDRMAQLCIDNLFNFFNGKPLVKELK